VSKVDEEMKGGEAYSKVSRVLSGLFSLVGRKWENRFIASRKALECLAALMHFAVMLTTYSVLAG
jgi:hypothetical protein